MSSLWDAGSSLLQATTEGAAAAGVSGSLWDTGILQGSAKKDPSASQPSKPTDGVESFIPIPMPSLFGASPFSSDAASPAQSEPTQTQRQASAVEPPASQEAIHAADTGGKALLETQPAEVGTKEEDVAQAEEEPGEGEGGGDGWGIEMDVAVEEEELMSLPAPEQQEAQPDLVPQESPQEAEESKRDTEEVAVDTTPAQAQGQAEEARADVEHDQNHVEEGVEAAEGLQGDWAGAMEEIEVEDVGPTGETEETGSTPVPDPGAVAAEAHAPAEEGTGAETERGIADSSEEGGQAGAEATPAAEDPSMQPAVEPVEEAEPESALPPAVEAEAVEPAETPSVVSQVEAEQVPASAQEAGGDAAEEVEAEQELQQLSPRQAEQEPEQGPAPEPVTQQNEPEDVAQTQSDQGPVLQVQPEPEPAALQVQEPEPVQEEGPSEPPKGPEEAEHPQAEAQGQPVEQIEGAVRAEEGQSRLGEPEEQSRDSSQQEGSRELPPAQEVPATPVVGREAHEIGEAEEAVFSTPAAEAADLAPEASSTAPEAEEGEARPREAEQVSSAAHAALEAALRVSSPRGPQGSPGANHDITPDPLLREQMVSMELALQNAAKQAQVTLGKQLQANSVQATAGPDVQVATTGIAKLPASGLFRASSPYSCP